MSWISLLGMLAILALAWAMSAHRFKVKIRTVCWGLGLQLLFAIIILRDGIPSYTGMTILAALVSVYLLSSRAASAAGGAGFVGLGLAGLAVAGLLFYFLLPTALPWALAALVLGLIVNGRWKLLPEGQSLLSAGFMTLGAAWLISRGISGKEIFAAASSKVASFLSLSDYGATFLFGNLVDNQYFFPGVETWPGFGFQFALKVLPTIIFFGGFMAVLYHLGVMQVIIQAMARFMRWTIGTSGAETLSCSANIFVGQTEAPLLIKPFLNGMTVSELCTIMVGGFATIAGGVLAGYISMGVDAGHLIAASVMSAPAALVIGKILYPETEHSQTAGDVEMPKIDSGDNIIEAATNGITDGLKLAANVGAMLLGFIALIAVVDVFLNWADSIIDGRLLVALQGLMDLPFEAGQRVDYLAVGMSPATAEYTGIFPGSLQTLFGTVLRPLAWLMGVPWQDAAQVGNLLGVKLSLNEFVAFGTLGSYIQQGVLSKRAAIISTYALCGFANFSSIGIQIGGISAIAPERKSELAKVGLKAMFGGALASWLTATIAGILIE